MSQISTNLDCASGVLGSTPFPVAVITPPPFSREDGLHRLFSIPIPSTIVEKCRQEEEKQGYALSGECGSFICTNGSQPASITPGWSNGETTECQDIFWANYTYSVLGKEEDEFTTADFRVTGSQSEVAVIIGDEQFLFPGRAPELKFSSGATFAVKYRGPLRSEIVEFELSFEAGRLKGRIINDSRTSDLTDIEYSNYVVWSRDYQQRIRSSRTFVFRGGIHAPHTIFSRVVGEKEMVWKDQAFEAGLDPAQFGRVVSTRLSCNGLSHVVHSILPPGHRPGQRHPTVFYVHGGPVNHYDGDFSSIEHAWLQFFASQGYVVVGINYRGNRGYGDDYQRAVIGDFGGQHVEDVRQIAEQVSRFDGVDPQKLHYFGHSFGSYTGAMLIAKNREFVQQTFKTMVLASGIYDWSKNLWAHDAAAFAPPFDTATAERRRDGWLPQIHKVVGQTETGDPIYADPADDGELNARISPMAQRSLAVAIPILLVQGDADKQVSPCGTVQFYQRLRQEGVSCECLFIPGADHAYSSPEAASCFVRNLADFFSRHGS